MSSPKNMQGASHETVPTSTNPRKQKLRSSCDACSASKVKCDQGLPTCARCVSMGIKCNYSPSRRMGKPPAIARDSTAKSREAKSSKKRPLLSPPLSSVSSHEQVTFESQNPSLDAFFLDTADFMPMQWQPSTYSSDSHFGDFNDCDAPPMFPHGPDTENDSISHPTTPQFPDFGFVGPSFTLDNECHEAMTVPSPIKNAFSSQTCSNPLALALDEKDSSSQPQDCASLVGSTLVTLHSLRVDAGACRAKAPNKCAQPLNSIEEVLITNKAAMECMDRTLACPCSHNPHYALTLALMCHKILVRYEAIVKTPHTANAPDYPYPPRTENFSATPITVGAYRMDAEDERRLKIQLVVNELRKMKGVIERYEEKYCATTDGDKDRRNSIYSALETFLRSDLKEKLKNMVNALQD